MALTRVKRRWASHLVCPVWARVSRQLSYQIRSKIWRKDISTCKYPIGIILARATLMSRSASALFWTKRMSFLWTYKSSWRPSAYTQRLRNGRKRRKNWRRRQYQFSKVRRMLVCPLIKSSLPKPSNLSYCQMTTSQLSRSSPWMTKRVLQLRTMALIWLRRKVIRPLASHLLSSLMSHLKSSGSRATQIINISWCNCFLWERLLWRQLWRAWRKLYPNRNPIQLRNRTTASWEG